MPPHERTHEGPMPQVAVGPPIGTWMRRERRATKITYVTHGEPYAAHTLRGRINRELRWQARVPENFELIVTEQPA